MSTTVQHRSVEGQRPRSNHIWLFLLLLIAGAIGIWAYMNTRPQPAQVTERDIVGSLPLQGELIVPPSARANIGAPFRAPVEKIEVSVGQRVSRGDTLVQLSIPSVDVAVQQAKANVQAAETAYANAKRQYDTSVRAAQQHQSATGQMGPTSTPDTTDSGGQNGNAPSAAPGDAAAAQSSVQQTIADRQNGLEPYRLQIEAAREAYQDAKSGAKVSRIRAPISGTVLALNASPGAEVGVDAKIPVATIVDLSKIQVQAEMNPDQAGYAKPGVPVLITFNDIPGRQFEGRVTVVTTKVETRAAGLIKNQKYMALVDFKNSEGSVRPGMKPNIALKLGEVKAAIAVPNEAIDRDASGRPIVKVLRGGAWQLVVVESGLTDGRYTQVKSGVHVGETVQVTPNLLQAASRAVR